MILTRLVAVPKSQGHLGQGHDQNLTTAIDRENQSTLTGRGQGHVSIQVNLETIMGSQSHPGQGHVIIHINLVTKTNNQGHLGQGHGPDPSSVQGCIIRLNILEGQGHVIILINIGVAIRTPGHLNHIQDLGIVTHQDTVTQRNLNILKALGQGQGHTDDILGNQITTIGRIRNRLEGRDHGLDQTRIRLREVTVVSFQGHGQGHIQDQVQGHVIDQLTDHIKRGLNITATDTVQGRHLNLGQGRQGQSITENLKNTRNQRDTDIGLLDQGHRLGS